MKELSMKELTDQAFKKYGVVIRRNHERLDADEAAHKWWGNLAKLPAEGEVSVSLMEVKQRDFIVEKLERHKKTAEMLIAIDGDASLVVGTQNGEDGKLDCIEAFYIKAGDIVVLNKETLHWIPFPFGRNALFAVVFRARTPEDDLYFTELEELVRIRNKA